jgi:hypothetical protein
MAVQVVPILAVAVAVVVAPMEEQVAQVARV